MSAPSLASRAIRDPRVVAAATAVALRAFVACQAFATHVADPVLDGTYYLDWAGDVAGGDVLGRAGTIHGEPFLFNPLYAYALAPLVGAFGKSAVAVVAFQTLLAGGTAALAASAARRFSGTLAAWIAGLAVAFSAALVHLDGKVAVSGLAAFLIAGATWTLSPDPDGAPPSRGHGPLAAGAWLGLSLLARPVTLFALPFVAWLVARRDPRRLRAALLFAAPVALCAGLSFARNVAVSGEPVVFTAADGLNLHLGNNPAARRLGAMATDEFAFGPVGMHDDARFRVAYELRRRPTRREISSWFFRRATDDFADAPRESVGWVLTKLRWFASPFEPSSSYTFDGDREKAPRLALAWLPTCALVAAAAAALTRRHGNGLLLGPGAIVLAHVVSCTIVYPLSHYRAPAIPAMAVMGAVVVAEVVAALRAEMFHRAIAPVAVAAAVATLGLLPPQVREYPEAARLAEEAMFAKESGDPARADDLARRALEEGGEEAVALTVRLNIANEARRPQDALGFARRLVALRPWDPHARLDVALAEARLGRREEALRHADEVVALYPWDEGLRVWRDKVEREIP